ncbi:hypothetical protein ACFW2V_13850 [Streptomyces sp. NPDC058947]|uniref:hypothetical protein n=1 Tax=Streptomyces sp. NPDC058947 TaxID=3346675 RepID=UPI00369DCC2C
MCNELIRFPEAGEVWEDTKEGGMYVFAIVPKPTGHRDNCTIENGIVLSAPDYPVSDIREYWPDMANAVQEEHVRNEAARLMDREGFAVKAAMVRGLASLNGFSTEMLAAVHMGSTSCSLVARNKDGSHWEAAWEDLTPTGTLLLDRLHVAFGVKPVLLTFLDT